MLKQTKSHKNSHKIGVANRVLLILIPIATGCAIASTPSLAATLALSDTNLLLNNFSHRPHTTSNEVSTDTFTKADPGSSMNASAEAFAVFLNTPGQPTLSYNTIATVGLGEGQSYFGSTEGKTKVVGNFSIGKNEDFGFNFAGGLELKTSIDNFLGESANAAGNIYFLVLDTTDRQKIDVLDYFLLTGKLSSPGIPDSLFAKKSSRVKFNDFSKHKDFKGKEESALGSVFGMYQRSFKQPKNLTVVQVQENSTTQQTKSLFSKVLGSGLESSVEALATQPTVSNSIVAEMGTESSELDTEAPTLSQESIVAAMGNGTLDTEGSYKSEKKYSGDIKGAIANNDKAKSWLKGKTKYTALLPDKIVKDLQVFSDISSGSWVDPPTTYGLEYTVEGDSTITNILDFFTDDADDLFTVAAEGKILGQFKSGDNINFVSLLGKGVSSFTITDINPLPGNRLANFNLRPLFNTKTANLQARAFNKSDSKSIPEPGFTFSLLAFGVLGVASRLLAKR